MSGRRLLVSGATGFIGGALVSALLDDGHDVHVIVRRRPEPRTVDGRATAHVGCDTPEAIDAAVGAAAPDACIHLASLYVASHRPADVPHLIQSNITFGTMLLEALTGRGCRRIIATGTAWQHFTDAAAASESVNLYAASKSAFDVILDWYADVHRMRAASVLLCDTYGVGDPRRKVVALLMQSAIDGQHLGMSPGEQLIDLVHVDDVIDAFRAAVAATEQLDPGRRAEWGVTSGSPLSLRALVQRCEEALGTSIDVTFGEREYREREVMRPWSPPFTVPGWRPRVALEDGLAALAADLRSVRD